MQSQSICHYMKSILAFLILVFTISSILGVAVANPNPVTGYPPAIMIATPISSDAGCYPNSTIPVNILVTSLSVINISYSLDGLSNITLTNLKNETENLGIGATTTLHNLAEGNHTLRLYSLDSDGKTMSSERIFTVDSSYVTPSLALISPKNKTYRTSEIPLTFSINAEYRNVHYSLDGTKNIFISGNSTITNLSDGKHTILMFADFSDKYHNWSPTGQGTSFNIDTKTPENNLLSLNQTNEIIIVSAVAVIVGLSLGFLIYRRHRKTTKSS